jgi:hypothetical protein
MYTAQARVVGNLRTKRRRLVDALHDMHEPLVALHDAEVEMLADAGVPAQVFPTALVRLSDVVLCYALEAADGPHRKSRAMIGVREEQVISQVVLQASGITISGDVHLPPDTTLAAYVTARNNAFLPMTGVRVTWAGGVSLVPDALVNSEIVSAFSYSVGLTPRDRARWERRGTRVLHRRSCTPDGSRRAYRWWISSSRRQSTIWWWQSVCDARCTHMRHAQKRGSGSANRLYCFMTMG